MHRTKGVRRVALPLVVRSERRERADGDGRVPEAEALQSALAAFLLVGLAGARGACVRSPVLGRRHRSRGSVPADLTEQITHPPATCRSTLSGQPLPTEREVQLV